MDRSLALLRSVTPEAATEAYQSVVHPDDLTVVVGDAERLADPLRASGFTDLEVFSRESQAKARPALAGRTSSGLGRGLDGPGGSPAACEGGCVVPDDPLLLQAGGDSAAERACSPAAPRLSLLNLPLIRRQVSIGQRLFGGLKAASASPGSRLSGRRRIVGLAIARRCVPISTAFIGGARRSCPGRPDQAPVGRVSPMPTDCPNRTTTKRSAGREPVLPCRRVYTGVTQTARRPPVR